MTNHTPGPWKIHRRETIEFSADLPKYIEFLIEAGPGDYGGFFVCLHRTMNRLDDEPVSRVDVDADAALIAAAPALSLLWSLVSGAAKAEAIAKLPPKAKKWVKAAMLHMDKHKVTVPLADYVESECAS